MTQYTSRDNQGQGQGQGHGHNQDQGKPQDKTAYQQHSHDDKQHANTPKADGKGHAAVGDPTKKTPMGDDSKNPDKKHAQPGDKSQHDKSTQPNQKPNQSNITPPKFGSQR